MVILKLWLKIWKIALNYLMNKIHLLGQSCLDNIKGHSCANKDTYISVIDTETNFDNEVMSIGIVIADSICHELDLFRFYHTN